MRIGMDGHKFRGIEREIGRRPTAAARPPCAAFTAARLPRSPQQPIAAPYLTGGNLSSLLNTRTFIYRPKLGAIA